MNGQVKQRENVQETSDSQRTRALETTVKANDRANTLLHKSLLPFDRACHKIVCNNNK